MSPVVGRDYILTFVSLCLRWSAEIMCGGHNTMVLHNTCEDSLLAAPLILDLVILTELLQRVQFR